MEALGLELGLGCDYRHKYGSFFECRHFDHMNSKICGGHAHDSKATNKFTTYNILTFQIAKIMTDETDETPSPQHDEHTTDPNLLEPYRYINAIPGKDIRGKLIDCFQLWLHVPEEKDESTTILKDIKQIIADLHNASLLIDDVEDSSTLRRGIPVAHSIFGIPSVLNCANYVYFFALERCYKLNNSNAMQVFVMEMLNLHRGQGHDIMVRLF